MSIRKTGTCSSSVIVSSSVYVCNGCSYTEIVKGDIEENKECPKCKTKMEIVSSQISVE